MKARKLPSGKWNIRVNIGSKDGKTQYKSITGNTRAEVERQAKDFGPVGYEITLQEACERFLRIRGEELSPSTLRGYTGTLTGYVEKDRIGAVKISRITSPMLQEWVGRIHASKKTKQNHLGFVLSVLRFHDVDRVFRVRIAPTVKKEMYTPTEEEVNRVLDLADPQTHLAICLACSGLRRGEICALSADDVDRKTRTVRISKALAKDPSGEWVLKTPKTRKSKRTVPLTQSVIDQIPEEGRVIPISPDVLTNRFAKLVRKAGVPHFRFHDLRSFSASLALSPAIGASRMSVKDLHGWETDRMLEEHYDRPMSDQKARDEAKILVYMENHLHLAL